jgi:hypothetical protein
MEFNWTSAIHPLPQHCLLMSIYPTPLKSQFADQIALVCISDAMTYRKLK